MQYYQIKDYVREHFGRTGIPTSFLDLALEAGRLEIENHANFWWMQTDTTFSLVDGTQTYAIGSGSAIDIARFKDAKALHWRASGSDTSWEPVMLGVMEKDELDLLYDTDDTGDPEYAVIVDNTLYVYPPDPNSTQSMKLFHYSYTSNPAQTSSDDLTKNFPMALIYSALAQGYELELKDIQGAQYWRGLLMGQILKIKHEHLKRGWKDQIIFPPRHGPVIGRRRLDNLQIYGDRVS